MTTKRRRLIGTLTIIFIDKAYGFLLDEQGEERFIHKDDFIDGDYDFEDLKEGDQLSFIPWSSQKGFSVKMARMFQEVA